MDTFVTTDDGIRLRVRADGPTDGTPMLLSNSLGTDLTMWDEQARAWSDRFRVVRYDTRGHGGSTPVPGDYTFDRLGRDALAVGDAQGWDKFTFVGLSMGAMTGFWLAANAANRLDRVVAANGAPFAGGPQLWHERAETVRRDGVASLAQTTIERWFTPDFANANPEVVGNIRTAFLATSPEGYSGCCMAIGDLDVRPSLPTIATPMLLIGAAHDGGPPPAVLEGLAGVIPGARFALMQASHLSNLGDPDRFNAVVREFVV